MKLKHAIAAAFVLCFAVLTYTKVAMRLASGTPPPLAPADQTADTVVVDKAARRLILLRNDVEIAAYDVSLGSAPIGHKQREGDERTPEGTYVIDWRNDQSIAHLSLHISYPNANDPQAAAARNESPGGNIMIHGILKGWGWLGRLHLAWDWTNGCIAVTNTEMREIWSLVPNGTPIKILPG